VLSRRGASEAGRLRTRLVHEIPVETPDGAGGVVIAWTAGTTIAADLEPVRAGERRSGEGFADLTTHRIVIRHRADVRAGHRFRLGDRIFEIRSIHDPQEDGRFLVCLADEEGRPG
jgi:SPP1 family predicted phage head-tail adaptor